MVSKGEQPSFEKRSTVSEIAWIRARVQHVPNPFLMPPVIPQAEMITKADTIFVSEGGYAITSADSQIASAPGSGEMSPCVAIGLYDPVTQIASVGHLNVFNDPASLDIMLADMLPGMSVQSRREIYPRLQATLVGGNPEFPRSVGLVMRLLQRLDSYQIPLIAAEVLSDPYAPGNESMRNSLRAFVIDTRHGGRIIPFKDQRRIGKLVTLKYGFPYYNPANPLQKTFDGRPGM